MIDVRLFLTGGHVYSLSCDPDGETLKRLSAAMNRVAARGGPLSGLLQVEAEIDGATRGLEIPLASIIAVETDPPHVLGTANFEERVETAPYIRIPDFLTPEENRAFLDFAVAREDRFRASTVSSGEKGYRESRVLDELDDMPVDIPARVRELVPDLLAHFELPPLDDIRVECQLTASNNADYFKLHSDNGSPDTANRILTYIYYFFDEPRRFGGGGLRMYDTRTADAYRGAAESHTHLRPENNTMVFFPSRVWHEVLPIDCASNELKDSRFTVNGWVRDQSQPVPERPSPLAEA